MVAKINADTSGGLKITSDTSGSLEIQSAGTTKFTVSSAGVAMPGPLTGLTSINGGQVGGNRNVIINGAQEVDQRHAGASVPSSSQYVTDRWKVQSAGSAGDSQQIASTIAGFKSSLKYTGDASIAWNQIGQQIEYKNYAHLVGEDVTISFYAKANNTNGGSTALTVRTRTVTGEDGCALFAGANTDTSVTISTTAARYTVARTIPADSKGFSVEFALGAHVNTDGYEITGIQLELGTVTAFEHRSFNEELALCQRYYEKSYDYDVAVGAATYVGIHVAGGDVARTAGTSYISGNNIVFTVRKRDNPTIVGYDQAGNAGKAQRWQLGSHNTNDQNATIQNAATRGFFFYSSGTSNSTGVQMHFTADAEL